MITAPAATLRRARISAVWAVYVTAAAGAFAVFVAGAALLATTLPFHDWDSFAFGDWSRSLAHGHGFDPASAGQQGSGRPLYYALQGALWAITGVSFTAGRLLSLAFAVLLVVAVAGLTRELVRNRPELRLAVPLAPLALLSIPAFSQEAVAGKSDVPAAAMVALTAWLALRRPTSVSGNVALGVVTALTVVTKATTLVPLVLLGAFLLVERDRRRAIALAAGGVAGVAYFAAMAVHFDTGFVAYLKTGTDGLWAQRAAAQRFDGVLGLDVLGGALRLPLAFGLLYAALRCAGLRHRRGAVPALAAALLWTIAGPAHVIGLQPFESAEQGFAYVGFAVLLAVACLAQDEDAPSRRDAIFCLALGLPPLALWAYATPYTARLAATAWPGLAVLIALCLVPALRVLRRADATFALVPVTVVAAAFWISVTSLDGLHGVMWQEYRQLGVDGLGDSQRTTNIVLPAVQSALATAEPALGDGRVSTSDPRFSWFLPGRVDEETDLHCSDLKDRVLILDTSDESEIAARDAGGLSTPEQWAQCSGLKQLSDDNGYAVFARTAS